MKVNLLGFGTGGHARLVTRQCQHLLDQTGRAVDTCRESPHSDVARCCVGRALKTLYLQLECGQRRPQFVRSVSDKVLLRIERMSNPIEQQVELMNQRPHFFGQALFAHRRKLVGLARGHLPTYSLHRRKRSTDHPPHHQHQQRGHQRDRADRPQSQRTGHALAYLQVLSHLYDQPAGLHREHAIGCATRPHVGKTEYRELRQCGLLRRLKDAHAVCCPDLHHELEVLLAGADATHCRARRQPGAQRKGHLLHVVVENLVGFVQHRAIGHQRLHTGCQHDGGQQEPQEARAQRTGHCPRHAFGTI